MRKILFVCSGNTCRSCIAEVIAKAMARELPVDSRSEIEFDSAGIAAVDGERASRYAREALSQIGLSAEEHRAKMLTEEMIRKADLVLTMQRHHRDFIRNYFSYAADRTFTLREFAYGKHGDLDIQDPYGMDLTTYINTRDEIHDALKRAFESMVI